MKSSTMLLLKTFLKSTSSINVLKYSQDKKKRKYAKNTLTGNIIGCIVLAFYVSLISIGLGRFSLADAIPVLCGEVLFAMPFIFTLLKAGGYLFGFKEYDMIMAMPFSANSVITAKFLYMYIKSFPLYGILSLSMLVGYIVGGKFSISYCIMWIILTVIVPVFPMIIATAIGALAAKISANFRYKNIVQAAFVIIILMPVFFSRFFIEDTLKNDELDTVMNSVADSITKSSNYMPFARWFSEAINDGLISSFLSIAGVTFLAYCVFTMFISKYYRQINSKIAASSSHKKTEVTSLKQRSVVKAVAIKEFKRMTGSSTYLVNVGLGVIMVPLMGIAMIFLKPETIINNMMNGAPIPPSILFPAIPMLFYFFLGMVPTTSCSPSLEGKNYWIMQTLPIEPMDDCKGKMLFNLWLFIPAGVFSTTIAAMRFGVSFIDGFISVIGIVCLIVFSTVFGLRSGLKHRRLDWENEIEVIKQGMAVSMCIIPHLVICIIGMPLVVVMNFAINNIAIIMAGISLLALIVSYLSWKGVKKYI